MVNISNLNVVLGGFIVDGDEVLSELLGIDLTVIVRVVHAERAAIFTSTIVTDIIIISPLVLVLFDAQFEFVKKVAHRKPDRKSQVRQCLGFCLADS